MINVKYNFEKYNEIEFIFVKMSLKTLMFKKT